MVADRERVRHGLKIPFFTTAGHICACKPIALHQRMNKAGLTLDDLERLEKELVTGTSKER